ncbi:MAG: hypothetical protein KDA84_26715, partial [Planctomycetaceae bacterium]|nr:hypothetical protein [Planctomycetaceae bacterium]
GFRVFDSKRGWSATYEEYHDAYTSNSIFDLFRAGVGEVDLLGNPKTPGNVYLLRGLIDLGSPEWPGAGTGGTWYVPDRIGPWDFETYFVAHDWAFSPQSLRDLESIFQVELHAFSVSVEADPTILPLQTIYSAATTSAGVITAAKNDLANVLSAIKDYVVPTGFGAHLETDKATINPSMRNELIGKYGHSGSFSFAVLGDATTGYELSEYFSDGTVVITKVAPEGDSGPALVETTLSPALDENGIPTSEILVTQRAFEDLDENGLPVGEPEVTERQEEKSKSPDKLGRKLGSSIGTFLAGDNPFSQVIGQTVGGVLGQQVAVALLDPDRSLFANTTESNFQVLITDGLTTLGVDFANQFEVNAIDALSSAIATELAESLNIDGFAGEIFTTAGATVSDQLLTNLIHGDLSGELALSNIFEDFELESLANVFADYAISQVSSLITEEIVDIDKAGEDLFATAGSIIASYFFDPYIGKLIGPIIGSVVFEALDSITGGWLEDLFDDDPWIYQFTTFDPSLNQMRRFALYDDEATAELHNVVQGMTDYYLSLVNSAIVQIGGQVNTDRYDSLLSPGQQPHLAHVRLGYHHNDNPNGDDDFKVTLGPIDSDYLNANGDVGRIVRIAAEWELRNTIFYGHSPLTHSVLTDWQESLPPVPTGDQIPTLYSNLDIAEDFGYYLLNQDKINTLMATFPNSPYTVGWTATLLKAESLELPSLAEDFLTWAVLDPHSVVNLYNLSTTEFLPDLLRSSD